MTRRFGILVAAALCVAVISSARAQDYRAEVEQHVIDPCYMGAAIRAANNTGASVDLVLRTMKIMNADSLARMFNVVVPVVSGKPLSSRMAIYKFALANCLRGARNARNR